MRFVSALLVIALGACSGSQPEALGPVSEEEALAFGQRLAGLLAPCDRPALAASTNGPMFLQRALDGVAVPDEEKVRLMAAATGHELWDGVCADNDRKRVALVGAREVDGAWRPILRRLDAHGFGHLGLELQRIEGRVQVVDFLSYAVGDSVSGNVNAMMRAMNPGSSAAGLGPMTRVHHFYSSGDVVRAREAYAELPAELRESRGFMLNVELKLVAGDLAAYDALLARIEARWPNDPTLGFIYFDRDARAGHWTRAIAALDRLDRVLRDPYLDSERARVLSAAGELEAARAASERAVAAVPDEPNVHDVHARICMAQRDHACTVATLERLASRFGVRRSAEELSAEEGGPELVASPEWKAYRAE